MTRSGTKESIHETLTRSISNVFPSREELEKELLSGRKLRVYLGADPTGPHLHLGHLTNLLVLKRLQDLGHEIIFLIGDFTAMIGDPTGKLSNRKVLKEKEVKKNMQTFKKQVSHIIYFNKKNGKNPAHISRNSEWYKKMTVKDFLMDLMSYFSVRNMLNRDMFVERKKIVGESEDKWLDAIQLKELIYPLLQGYDGVVVAKGGVDIEVGGNDQIFNMNIGRALRKAYIGKDDEKKRTRKGEKFFIATVLLVNPKTGKKLMNKSEGGLINMDDSPSDIFGKVMAIDDNSMFAIAEHCTLLSLEAVEELRKLNPRDAKIEIANAVVKTIYGQAKAISAEKNWVNTFSKKEISSEFPELKLKSKKINAVDFVLSAKTVKSKSEARRLIEQGAIEVNGEVKKNPYEILELKDGETAKIGKKIFFRIRIK